MCRVGRFGRRQYTLEARSARVEGIHTVLRGITYGMVRPRESWCAERPLNVRVEVVEVVEGLEAEDRHSWVTPD